MARRVQLRRGTTAEHPAFTGAIAETTVDTTSGQLRVHNGETPGGAQASPGTSIEWTGARGDGTTDDAAAVQDALDDFKHVIIPNRSFRMGTTPLTIDSIGYQRIIGAGPHSSLIWDDDFEGVGIDISVPFVQLADFYVRKERSAVQPDATVIGIQNNSHSTFYDGLRVYGEGAGAYAGWGTGVKLLPAASAGFTHVFNGGFIVGEHIGVYGNLVNTVWMDGTTVAAAVSQGVLLNGGVGHALANVNVEGGSTHGIYIQQGGGAATGSGNVCITGGHIEGPNVSIKIIGSEAPGHDVRGVSIHGMLIYGLGTGSRGIEASRVDGLTVTGCNILGFVDGSIDIGGLVDNAFVMGNYLEQAMTVYPASRGIFQGLTPITAGLTTGFTAATGTAVLSGSTFTGGIGSTAYTIGSMVEFLKKTRQIPE